ncbi:MAG: hypothetical protein H7296_06160 [Bacteroidia bacterium]|nr:hypothetical protein [Bacteroidia bacterium]
MLNSLKIKILLATIILFFSSCGTTGHIRFYDYNVSKDSLENALKSFLLKNPSFKCPVNDSMCSRYYICDSVLEYVVDEDRKLHYVYTKEKIRKLYIYFHTEPEEIYRLEYYGDSKYWKEHPSSSRLALVAVVKVGGKWRYSGFLNRFFRGRRHVESRLEDELLSKLPYEYEIVEIGD